MKTQDPVRFYQKCLKCGKPNDSQNYTCSCSSEPWTKEYRILDVEFSLTPDDKERAVLAFRNYDIDHPAGILQYIFNPYPEHTDKITSMTGLTPFIPLDHLSRHFDTGIFLKNDGDNPSGCFKDRETVMAALHSIANGKNRAVVHSSGNAAASASLFASQLGFQLITCVAGNTYPEKIDFILEMGSDVIRIGNSHATFEEGYRLLAEMNAGGFFVEHGYDNWSVHNPYRIIGDKTTSIEIAKQYAAETGQTGAVPDFIVVPTGNGTCLAGIWKGFKELKNIGAIEKLPKMVSAAIKNASPVYKAYLRNQTHRPAVCDPDDVAESDKEIGSTILAEEGYDSIEATKAVIESGGLAMEVTRKDIGKALVDLMSIEREAVQRHNILPEPASLVTIAAIERMRRQAIVDENSNTVGFISGHGAKARDLLLKMLKHRPDLQNLVDDLITNRNNGGLNNAGIRRGHMITVPKDIEELKNAFRQLNNPSHEGEIFTT